MAMKTRIVIERIGKVAVTFQDPPEELIKKVVDLMIDYGDSVCFPEAMRAKLSQVLPPGKVET